MLLQLDIQNVAIIDRVSIELGKGLNILTGETGAGKSIIIDSINAILGERVSKELIRTGKDKARIEAVFQVDNSKLSDIFEELGIEAEEDGTLIISREFTLQGRNICRINGQIATVTMVKKIGERIIDVHGQHDNQSLLRTDSHIRLLDAFAGERIQMLKQKYHEILSNYNKTKSRLMELTGDKYDIERKIDILKYQVDEIKKARLKTGEEEELNKQRIIYSNAEKIIAALSGAYELLCGGNNLRGSASDAINEAMSEVNSIVRFDEKYLGIAEKLENIVYNLEDVVEEIRRERDLIEYDPDLVEQIEERLDLIYKLKRKYGPSVEEVLEFCKKAEKELEEVLRSEELAEELKKELSKLNEELYTFAIQMNNERQKAAKILEDRIGNELADLEMKNAKFKVNIEFDDRIYDNGERKYTGNGLDKVEFLISPNVGEPLKPLSKIASGGEMSRIMLAIKNILANVDSIPTLIFDEIDIGISGRASQKVGEKLSSISKNHQVICVTHLAQIACMADNHYLIEKISDKSSTRTVVKKLSHDESKYEIARIISGSDMSDITIKHAEEMLENARKIKGR